MKLLLVKNRVLVAAAWTVLAAVQPAGAAPERALLQTARVSRVVDGDTVWVKLEARAKPIKVRILGIDAPEICQQGGAEAQQALAGRVLGQWVTLQVQPTRSRDDYGRWLARLQWQGSDVGRWLVQSGHAWSYTYRRDPGPYASEQAMATAARRGVFADAAAENPRQFRQRHGACAR